MDQLQHQQRRKQSRHHLSHTRTAAAAAAATLIAALAAVPAAHAFQYAVFTSTSCETLAYSITLDTWEYKSASYLRTAIGDPSNPTRFTLANIDKFFKKDQLEFAFLTKWNRPLPVGGNYALFFGLLDHKQRPIKIQNSALLDNATVTLTIPPCTGSSSLVQSSSTSAKSSSSFSSTSTTLPSTMVLTTVTSSSSASTPILTPTSPALTSTPHLPYPSSTSSSGQPSASSSDKKPGISPGAMAGAVVGAVVFTLFALWIAALCRRRIERNMQNHSAQRASYLGPAPRPLLTPSRSSGRYYHTPTPGSHIPVNQSKTAAFFSFFTGGNRRRRSIIHGIPQPVMRQHYGGGRETAMWSEMDASRGSMGTVTPILRRPEDGFTPVGTAEQVAARRFSRDSATRSLSIHGVSRPSSAADFHYPAQTNAAAGYAYGGSTPGFGSLHSDNSRPSSSRDVSAVGNLVDTSETPAQQLAADRYEQVMSNAAAAAASQSQSPQLQQQYPRPFLLGAAQTASRPGSANSSRTTQSRSTPNQQPRRPSINSTITAGTVSSGNRPELPRPPSAGSTSSQPFFHPHKMNRPRNNDWATPYTAGSAGTGGASSATMDGRSRASSSASSRTVQKSFIPLMLSLNNSDSAPTPPPMHLPTSQQVPNVQSPTAPSVSSANMPYSPPPPPYGPSGISEDETPQRAPAALRTSGLIPLQLAGSATTTLMAESLATGQESMHSRDRESSISSFLSGLERLGGAAPTLSLHSNTGLPYLSSNLTTAWTGGGVGGGGDDDGGGMMPPPAASTSSGFTASTVEGVFGSSPLLAPIATPAPIASPGGGPHSFLPRSGSSSPARSMSSSPAPPGPPAPSLNTASSSSSMGTGPNGMARKRPSFSYGSNDPVAYMQATAGFARPPSRANSVSSANHGQLMGGHNRMTVDSANPLFAALSHLDD
ncbi:hypothetical protein OC861_002251 [Tilletia horrida]|nr:hypothetical protein OC845_000932 [Tilletia horrida]KAK0568160.1 hypothetical protein OC861_002251 [Tilletia horrida]